MILFELNGQPIGFGNTIEVGALLGGYTKAFLFSQEQVEAIRLRESQGHRMETLPNGIVRFFNDQIAEIQHEENWWFGKDMKDDDRYSDIQKILAWENERHCVLNGDASLILHPIAPIISTTQTIESTLVETIQGVEIVT